MLVAVRSIVFFLALLFVAPAFAAAGPKGFVESKHSELTALLKKEGAQSEASVSAAFDSILDYEALAQRALGDHWASRSDAERKEFTAVLQGLVKTAYRKNLKKTLAYDVQVTAESPVDGGTLVKTVAKHRTDPREAPLSIDYALHKVGNDWRIFDIVTEGSSLVKNYKSQFNRVIRKNGFPELLSRMKRKLAEKE